MLSGISQALKPSGCRIIALAALQIARELGPGHTAATVAVDTGLKYLAGDLFDE
jgi:cysteine synthase